MLFRCNAIAAFPLPCDAFPPLNGCHSLPCQRKARPCRCASRQCHTIAKPFCTLPPRSSPSPMHFSAGLCHRASRLCFPLAVLLFAMPFAKQSAPSYALAHPSYAFAARVVAGQCNANAVPLRPLLFYAMPLLLLAHNAMPLRCGTKLIHCDTPRSYTFATPLRAFPWRISSVQSKTPAKPYLAAA